MKPKNCEIKNSLFSQTLMSSKKNNLESSLKNTFQKNDWTKHCLAKMTHICRACVQIHNQNEKSRRISIAKYQCFAKVCDKRICSISSRNLAAVKITELTRLVIESKVKSNQSLEIWRDHLYSCLILDENKFIPTKREQIIFAQTSGQADWDELIFEMIIRWSMHFMQ